MLLIIDGHSSHISITVTGEVTDRQIAPSSLFLSNDIAELDVKSIVKPSSHYRESDIKKDLYDDNYLQRIRDNNLRLPTADSICYSICTSG